MRKTILILAILFTCIFSFAQEVKFTAKTVAKAGVGQNFQVQFTLNKKPSKLSLGDYSGLKLVNGPSVSTVNSINYSGGHSTQSTTYTYTYYFKASKAGNYTIAASTAVVNGKSITSNSISVVIQEEAVQSNNNNNTSNTYDPWADFYKMMGYDNSAPAQTQEITSEDFFVKVYVDKTNLYKGEHINATIKLYTKYDIIGAEENLPSLDDFIVEEMETSGKWVRETYNNQVYNTFLVRKYILYPRISGDLVIEPCEYICQLQQPIQNSRYRGYYGYNNPVTKTVRSPEIKIKVNQLPNPPESFTGAVGNFKLNLSQSEDTVLVNDAVSLKFTISGNGNFDMVETPSINWPKEFEVYEPVAEQNLGTNNTGVYGDKTWEYTIIPRYPGIFKLGNFSFTYFDTNTKQYKTVKSKSITIAVKKDENDNDFGEDSYNYSQKNIDYISEDDIRFVNFNRLKLKHNYNPVVKRGFYIWLFILPLLIFIVLVIVMRKRIKENADIAMVKQRKAGRTSQKRLKKARNFMSKGEKTEFYKEIISALWGYCADKLEIQVADLTKDRIKDILIVKGVEGTQIDKLLEVIDNGEFAHFAPTSAETELSFIYNEATSIIENLEQTIK